MSQTSDVFATRWLVAYKLQLDLDMGDKRKVD